jgi:formylmethanofuran dehydrogenase subunit B
LEAKLDEGDDIIDEEKLFYMGKKDFDKMIKISRAKETLKKQLGEYRNIDFKIIMQLISEKLQTRNCHSERKIPIYGLVMMCSEAVGFGVG